MIQFAHLNFSLQLLEWIHCIQYSVADLNYIWFISIPITSPLPIEQFEWVATIGNQTWMFFGV